jgi:uncharacterized cupin superfamily protein
MPKKIDVNSTQAVTGSRYPPPFHEPCARRFRRRLGDAAGLTQFGVNLTRLPAGGWSSQRHWHAAEDEFLYAPDSKRASRTDTNCKTAAARMRFTWRSARAARRRMRLPTRTST